MVSKKNEFSVMEKDVLKKAGSEHYIGEIHSKKEKDYEEYCGK